MAFARCTERSFSLPFLISPPIKLDLDSSLLNSFNLSYEEGDGTPLQYSCLENPMDGGAWWAAVHGVARIRTRLSDFTFTFHFHALKKEMATHSSVLAWRIPGTGEPGALPSIGSHRVGHNWSDLAAAAAATLINLSYPLKALSPTIVIMEVRATTYNWQSTQFSP